MRSADTLTTCGAWGPGSLSTGFWAVMLRLLHQDCGSCHGLRLTGGLGPALTPGALKDKPDASLTATIVSGRPGTPMPPWQPFISEDEARWLVERLKEGTTDGK